MPLRCMHCSIYTPGFLLALTSRSQFRRYPRPKLAPARTQRTERAWRPALRPCAARQRSRGAPAAGAAEKKVVVACHLRGLPIMRQRKRRKNRNSAGYQRPDRRGRSASVQCAHCLNFFQAKGLHQHLRSCALAAGGGSSALGDADGVLRSSFGFVAGNDNEDDDFSEDQGLQLVI